MAKQVKHICSNCRHFKLDIPGIKTKTYGNCKALAPFFVTINYRGVRSYDGDNCGVWEKRERVKL